MNFYQTFEAMAKTRKRKLASNTYLVVREDGGYGVKLYDTEIVIHYSDRTVFNSGGWKTAVTEDRMNAFSDHRVYSEKGVWYIDSHPYADGITVYDDGRVVSEGDSIMDNFTAVGLAEGFIEADSEEQVIEAWQHLIDTGLCWSLQGFFGRTATRLIEAGVCASPESVDKDS